MKYHTPCEPPLAALDRGIACAVAFFGQIDEGLSDGHQTARHLHDIDAHIHGHVMRLKRAAHQPEHAISLATQ